MVPTVMSTAFSLGQDGQLILSWIFLMLQQFSCATKPSHHWSSSLMGKLIAWLFSGECKGLLQPFHWSNLITISLADTTTRNLLTHSGQVNLSNCTDHGLSYVSTQTRDAQGDDMLYYFLVDSLKSKFRAKDLLYAASFSTNNVVAPSALLKQIIILTRINKPAAKIHMRELLIECKKRTLKAQGRCY